jgi:chorismate synthase
MSPAGFLSNNAGGILGGISTGQDIVVNVRHQTHIEHSACRDARSTKPAHR